MTDVEEISPTGPWSAPHKRLGCEASLALFRRPPLPNFAAAGSGAEISGSSAQDSCTFCAGSWCNIRFRCKLHVSAPAVHAQGRTINLHQAPVQDGSAVLCVVMTHCAQLQAPPHWPPAIPSHPANVRPPAISPAHPDRAGIRERQYRWASSLPWASAPPPLEHRRRHHRSLRNRPP